MSEPIIDYSRKWYVMATLRWVISCQRSMGPSSTWRCHLGQRPERRFPDCAVGDVVLSAHVGNPVADDGAAGRIHGGEKADLCTGDGDLHDRLRVVRPVTHRVLLIGFRVLQAIGASMTMASGRLSSRRHSRRPNAARRMGISGTMVAIGIVTGPLLGGIIVDALSWHWIFLVKRTGRSVGIFMVLRLSRVPGRGEPALRFSGGRDAVKQPAVPVAGANDRARNGFVQGTDPRAPGGVVGFAGTLILVESRVTQPMIDLGCSVMRISRPA